MVRKRKYCALAEGEGAPAAAGDAPTPVVHNIVATTRIWASALPIDLQHAADILPHSCYDRQKFAAITIRVREPCCTALLFTSGKLVLTGCRGWHECVLASMRIVAMLREYNPFVDFRMLDITVQNIVAHVAAPLPAGTRLDLDALYAAHCVHCTYQPHLFPGLIFRPDNSPIVLICFFTGNIVVTGGKCAADIERGWARLWPLVRSFVRGAPRPGAQA